jgi:large subunit ribosomal protein L21
MYAVIRTGGKQARVEQGQRLDVELLGKGEGDEGETKGPKIRGFTYKNKTNQRRRWGHRQRYSTIEITGISR